MLLGVVLLVGCGEPALGHVAVYRHVPDTLYVQVRPPASLFQRGPGPVEFTISASDPRGFVLGERRVPPADGVIWPLPVPDTLLGSRARVMVEVCGRIAASGGAAPRVVCEQRPVPASPKRVRATARVAYPVRGDRERAVARVAVAFERHDGHRWRPIPTPPGLTYALRVWVEGAPSDAVTAPLVAGRDTVRLTSDPAYDAYWLRLNERVFYGEGARVHLAVLARWTGAEAVVVHVTRTVRPPSDGEREAQVNAFARAAARGLARTLSLPVDSATVQLEAWRFDRIRQRYALDLFVQLHDSTGVPVRLRGRLDVSEAGQDAVFREAVPDSLRVPLALRLGRL